MTGHQLGRAAIRALEKNEQRILTYLDTLHAAKSSHDLLDLEDKSYMLGHVKRSVGGGRFVVQYRDGVEETVRVAGSIAFHGRAGSKTDRANCIFTDCLIIVCGGLASAKLDHDSKMDIKKTFDKLGFPYPKGFFTISVAGHEGEEDDCGFDFAEGDEEEDDGKDVAATLDNEEPELDVDAI